MINMEPEVWKDKKILSNFLFSSVGTNPVMTWAYFVGLPK